MFQIYKHKFGGKIELHICKTKKEAQDFCSIENHRAGRVLYWYEEIK